MQTKSCPSCGLDVPSVAYRCKECFHDFQAKKEVNNGPLVLLGMLAVMAIVGATTFGVIRSFPTDQSILVHEPSETVIFTRQYSVGNPETERLPFKQIATLEHVIESNGTYSVVAVLNDGSRRSLANAKRSQKGRAEKYARMMQKPFREDDRTSSFMKKALDDQINAQTPGE